MQQSGQLGLRSTFRKRGNETLAQTQRTPRTSQRAAELGLFSTNSAETSATSAVNSDAPWAILICA